MHVEMQLDQEDTESAEVTRDTARVYSAVRPLSLVGLEHASMLVVDRGCPIITGREILEREPQ